MFQINVMFRIPYQAHTYYMPRQSLFPYVWQSMRKERLNSSSLFFSFIYCFPSFRPQRSYQHTGLKHLHFVLQTGIQPYTSHSLVSTSTENQARNPRCRHVPIFQNATDILLSPLELKCSISHEYTCLFRISRKK